MSVIWYISEAFGGTRMGNFDIKSTDGATCIFIKRWENLNRLMSEIREEDEKWNGSDGWTSVFPVQ